jgi:hypothetical protein
MMQDPEFDRDSLILEFKKIERERRLLMAVCAKCGKEIPVGQEVRKGLLRRKSYHKDTCVMYCDIE